ncbi:MAG: hypothetical protein P8Y30_01995, partial [candidate division WOR-3 bacterium]
MQKPPLCTTLPGFSIWVPTYTHEGKTTKFTITSGGTTLVYESITHLLTIQSRGHSREYTIRSFDDSVFITGIKTNDNAIIFSIQNIYYGSITAVLFLDNFIGKSILLGLLLGGTAAAQLHFDRDQFQAELTKNL